jgi:hypothetical protein
VTPLITSIRIAERGAHVEVWIWIRHALAGTLTMRPDEAERFRGLVERTELVEAAAEEVNAAFGGNPKLYASSPWGPKIRALKVLRAALAAAPTPRPQTDVDRMHLSAIFRTFTPGLAAEQRTLLVDAIIAGGWHRDAIDEQAAGIPSLVPPAAEPRRRVATSGEIVHLAPPDNQALMPCCGRTPFELSNTDRLTLDPELVTCRAAVPGEEGGDAV